MATRTFDRLYRFISTEMRMSHVYQPVMLRTLLERNGQATVREIAEALLNQDRAQLAYYEEITRRMPGDVLRKRGVVEVGRGSYRFFTDFADREKIAKYVLEVSEPGIWVQEYQLFWYAMMLEEYLMSTKAAPALIKRLFYHPNATDISRAKILEIADLRYGLPELRNASLSSGQSDWLSWSSAVGSRAMKPAARNYKLGYFMNSSDMNRLIGEVVKTL